MRKALRLLCTLFIAIVLHAEVLACDAPTNLRTLIEQDVPGYGYKYRVTFYWDAVDNGSYYSIYFYNANYPEGIWLGDSDGLYYIAGANSEGTFQFSVMAHCSDGSISDRSELCDVVIQEGSEPCQFPTNFQATVEEDLPNGEYKYTITLTWDPVANADKYELYINNDLFTYTTETTYVTGVQTAQVLYFAIATICEDGSSSIVSPNIVVNVDPCMPPTNLKATVEEDVPGYYYKYKVTLTWDENPDATSYTIYENGLWKGYAMEPQYEIGYNNPTTVFFNVTSTCPNGESDMTDPVTVEITDSGDDTENCLAPTNLGAIIEQDVEDYQYKFKVTMTWDDVENAGSYKVFVNGSEFGATSTNFYIAGSDNEGTFEYSVKSLCPSGESEMSESYTVVVQEVSLEEYANRFEIYPNPAENHLNISTTENINEVNIFNIIGVKVYSEQNFKETIDLSNFNSGVYFIKINTDKGEITKRFIKQ